MIRNNMETINGTTKSKAFEIPPMRPIRVTTISIILLRANMVYEHDATLQALK